MARSSVLDSLIGAGGGARPNLARALAQALPAGQVALLKLVAQRAAEFGMPLYVVGGAVRDLLLGRPISDVDLVAEGDAIRLGRGLVKQFGGKLVAHKRFGTAKWGLSGIRKELTDVLAEQAAAPVSASELPATLDLISARSERYSQPGALPDVEFDSIAQDQLRRDFGLNTLALRLDGEHFGELLDSWGGLDDLRQGQLRVLHEGSFVDDPTRILRVLRFAVRFGFSIETETLRQLKRSLGGLAAISGERVRHELDAILGEAQRGEALRQAETLGVLKAIHPALGIDDAAARRLERHPNTPPSDAWELSSAGPAELAYLLWLCGLSPAELASVADRLQFERNLRQALEWLIRLLPEAPKIAHAVPSQVVAQLEGAPMLAIYAVFLLAEGSQVRKKIDTYALEWRHVRPTSDGTVLKARGLQPGPAYGPILAALRAAWLDGEIGNPEEESALLDKLIAEHGG